MASFKSKSGQRRIDRLLRKEFLIQKYIIEGKTCKKIAEKIGCSISVISVRLKRYNIPTGKNPLMYLNDETKICTKCGIEKPLSEFHKRKDRCIKTYSACKVCERARRAEYHKLHFKPKPRKKAKAGYKICTKCKIEKLFNEFTKAKKGMFGLSPQCKVCRKIESKEYHDKHRLEKNAKRKVYYKAHKKEHNVYSKAYRKANKDRLNAIRRKRCKIDSNYRLNCNMSCYIYNSLKGNKKGAHWEDIVGYNVEKLKKHLEKQFTVGMTWENYGKNGWEIDHKVPKSIFNFTKPGHRDFKRCWALKNLQPMWAKENNCKRAKLTSHFQPSLLV